MKKHLLLTGIFSLIVCLGFATSGVAATQNWENQFTEALTKAKQAGQAGASEGLGYTPPQKRLLNGAISNAMAHGGPVGQIIEMAMNMDFDPYPVLLSIYSQDKVPLKTP